MTDREKVIKGLECCAAGNSGKCIKECPYDFVNANCTADMARDALELLKEQSEIVRCKDCKHWRQLYGDKPFYSHIGCCDCDDMWRSLDGETTEVNDIRTDSDFYCGYADRR